MRLDIKATEINAIKQYFPLVLVAQNIFADLNP